MRRHFGSIWTRSIFGSGTTLTDTEHHLTEQLILRLPEDLRLIAEAQFDAYDLVQRESDGRALNFYRKGKTASDGPCDFPLIPMTADEATLIRATVKVGVNSQPLHVTLNAVQGRVFCVAFDRRIDSTTDYGTIRFTEIKDSWRTPP